ncbi:MAG: hypothetical protein GF404_06405 [candidate division Zixibacteria bacterium]|jgi:hypothetical protein|nr:hypothetical protein [candidate division Zixibacteria bacterium]
MSKLTDKYPRKKPQECAYVKVCYLSEAMDCFGYKQDCPLYIKSNGNFLSERSFHEAVDKMIDKTKAKHLGLL